MLGRQGRDIVGARVGIVRANGPTLWRRARADGSYASANDPRVLVGLGDTAAIMTRSASNGRTGAPKSGPTSRRSIHHAEGRRRPVRAPIVGVSNALLAAQLRVDERAKTVDRAHLAPVVLPDLSRLEESVQAQLRERYAVLLAETERSGNTGRRSRERIR